MATDLFQHCSQSWAALERSVLIFEPIGQRLALAPETQPVAVGGLTIAIPIRPIIATLRQRLLLERPEVPQEPLWFPPTAVSAKRHRGDAS
jgi:hypothetical protein